MEPPDQASMAPNVIPGGVLLASSPTASNATAPETPYPLSPSSKRMIELRIGERVFTTTADTLTAGSGYFASLLSGRWDKNLHADGSYSIDADGATFEHVLRFLRHEVFPIFYDNAKGFDFTLYRLLLDQAQYFHIPKLEGWIKNKNYLDAVKIRREVKVLEGSDIKYLDGTSGDVRVEHFPIWGPTGNKIYVCPRGIPVHRGHSQNCGQACRRAQGDDEVEYEDEIGLRIVEIKSTTVVD